MKQRVPGPLPWLAALLAIYLIAPLLAGVQQVGLAEWRAIDGAALARACAVSIGSATLATLLIALGGIPLGYLLARVPGRAMALLGFLVQLPLALPPLTSGILLLFLVGYDAPLGHLTGGALTDSFLGIVLSETFVAAPFLVIAARSAFAAMDAGLEGVAATLGRGPWQIFLRVSLPIGWPTIASGLLLAWLRAFGEFGATVMVAYHPYSLPVYTYVAFGAQGLPAMLPVLLPTLVLALIVMALGNAIGRPRNSRRAGTEHRHGCARAARGDRGALVQEQGSSGDLALRLRKHLGDFSLEIAWTARARRLAILGASGSGKSLTLRLIAGIERADEAIVKVGDDDLSRLAPAARRVAYVPQNYGLFPHLTVIEQLHFVCGADPKRVQHWLRRLGLGGLEHRYPAALSLGQQQRVALARALAWPARLILLDEPFSALDAPLRARLRLELLTLQREFDARTILVTHDPEEAALLADELLVIGDGRLLQSGPTDGVFRRPASERVARLLGAQSVAEGIAAAQDRIALGDGVILEVAGPALLPGKRVGWSIRPGGVRLALAGSYEGRVESCLPIGVGRQITLRLGDARLTARDEQAHDLGTGPCRLDIDPCSVQVWPRDQGDLRFSVP